MLPNFSFQIKIFQREYLSLHPCKLYMEKDIFVNIIAERLKLCGAQVQHTIDLLESGCTIPFISRYRKEATGALDEVQIAAISE